MNARILLIGILLYTFALVGNSVWESKFITHNGVIITDFMQDSPARNAGLVINSTITAIDGMSIVTSRDYINALRTKKAGETVTVHTTAGSIPVILAKEPIRGSARLGLYVEDKRTQQPNLPQHLEFTMTGLFSFIYWLGVIHIIISIAMLRTTAWTEVLLLNTLNIFDIITTNAFLALGKTEGNPFGLYLFETLGFTTTALIKILVVFAGSLILAYLSQKTWKTRILSTLTRRRIHLKGTLLIYLFAVLINIRVLV